MINRHTSPIRKTVHRYGPHRSSFPPVEPCRRSRARRGQHPAAERGRAAAQGGGKLDWLVGWFGWFGLARARAKAKARARARAEAKARTKAKAKVQAKARARAKPKAMARARARAEAKA